jgi:hypothetical protein
MRKTVDIHAEDIPDAATQIATQVAEKRKKEILKQAQNVGLSNLCETPEELFETAWTLGYGCAIADVLARDITFGDEK